MTTKLKKYQYDLPETNQFTPEEIAGLKREMLSQDDQYNSLDWVSRGIKLGDFLEVNDL